jgi:hypothetical protein
MSKKNPTSQPTAAHMQALNAALTDHISQKQKAGVILHTAQQDFVHFSIDVTGGSAQWAFSCEHRSAIQKSDPTHPKDHYEFDLHIADTDASDDMYAVGFLFIGAPKYHLVIDHRDSSGTVIEPLQDRTFEGKDDDPPQFATLHVFVV